MHPLRSIILQQATPTSVPDLSRNGTILLELRRRHVSQRLNELQITLGQIRRCQQRDSESKDGTRGRTPTDSSSAQQEQGEHCPDIDGCHPTGGQGLDSIPASSSHCQKIVMRTSFGNYNLESHISDQRGRDTVESNNPDTSGIQRPENDLNLNVSGQQEQSSQVTIENTSGHTDVDAM